MADPGFVKIIHSPTQNIAYVHESSLPYHYRAGWALLDESPLPEPEPPAPVRARVASKAKSDTKEGE